jgi:serine/threonine protein kinase
MNQVEEHWQRTQRVFHEVAEVGEPERTAILEARCEGDTALMDELRSLLRACEAEESHRHDTAAPKATPETTRETTQIGPYELDHLIGRGGMGAVYLAHRSDGQFHQQVAVKLIDIPVAGEFLRERFRQERQILALLSHPFIARLLGGGITQGGELYLALEYVEGISITQYCSENKLSLHARLKLFLQVCDAVQYAHQNLVIHRDLKPDNILIAHDGTPRLLDFGTAKLLEPSPADAAAGLTQNGLRSYTPQYASPEQVMGEPVTTASDTYSLGVLLYLLLTGVPAYTLKEFTTTELLRVVCQELPPKPSAVAQLPERPDSDIDAVLLKALRKDPRERYLSVDQFAADLSNILAGRPVLARAPTLRYRAARFARRNKLALAAACLLLLTLVAGIGGILWQSRIANLERRRAEARSADLRELSNSLLSELDDALKEIPGSTGAQKLLVTRVLEHLDHMANDAAGDRQTTLDLIEAYTRLGNVQGNLYYQNLADTSGAVASFDKALALAAPLAKTYPSDKDVLRAQAAAFEARGEALSQANQAQASVASLRSAVAIYDRVTQLPGMTPALIFEAAIAYETLGNELAEDFGLADPAGGAAAYHRAIDMDEQALRLNPNFMPVRRGLPVMHLHLGNLLLETEPTASLQEVKLALSLQAALPPDQRGRLNQLRVHAVLLRKQAVAYGELGQYALADPLFAESLSSSQHFVDADAKDASALADLQRDLDDAAVSYESAANPLLGASPRDRNANLATAEQLLVREIETIRQDMKLSSTTDDDKPLLASVQIHLDAIRSALHHAIRSPAETSLSLAVLRHLADDPHATAGDIDLAVQADLIAQPASLRDPAHDVVLAERGVALTRRREATYFLLLARACRANHQPGQAAAREGLSLLPTLPSATPKSRLQILLQDAASGRSKGI